MTVETAFTPVTAAIGGLLIALAATLLMLGLGRISGISGIVRGAVVRRSGEWPWQLAFLLGMLAAAGGAWHFGGYDFELREDFPRGLLVLGGLAVGYGTALGSGCTSGHGVCGLARFSLRSLVATMVFLGTGIVTVFIVRHVLGGLT